MMPINMLYYKFVHLQQCLVFLCNVKFCTMSGDRLQPVLGHRWQGMDML